MNLKGVFEGSNYSSAFSRTSTTKVYWVSINFIAEIYNYNEKQ